jgi:hypothetical protein
MKKVFLLCGGGFRKLTCLLDEMGRRSEFKVSNESVYHE